MTHQVERKPSSPSPSMTKVIASASTFANCCSRIYLATHMATSTNASFLDQQSKTKLSHLLMTRFYSSLFFV